MHLLHPPSDPSARLLLASDLDALVAADLRPTPPSRPWVLVNMIASADGATVVEGTSGGLGGPADKAMFGALRAIADVILVAAGTVRAEHYRPPQTSAARRESRVARGQAASPRLAVVTASLDLDPTAALFGDPTQRPLVLTGTDAPAERRTALAPHADVISIPSDRVAPTAVDLPLALAWLGREHQARVVLVEGGPSFNGALLAEDLVDELCLTVAPALVGGSSARVAQARASADGPATTTHPQHLARVIEDAGFLLLRYTRA